MAGKHILVIEPHDPGGEEPPPATTIIPVPVKPSSGATPKNEVAAAAAAMVVQELVRMTGAADVEVVPLESELEPR